MSNSEQAPELPPAWQFHQLMTAYYVPQAIYVAAQLGLADQLASHPHSADELARVTGTNPAALNLLLYALSSVGIFAATPDGIWRLTPLATYLQSDTPHSQRGWALFHGNIGYRTWAELRHTIDTGAAMFARAFGADFYSYMATHPEIAAEWDTAMNQTARGWLGALTASYDFHGLGTVVDVGGGQGALLAGILRDVPALRGILFDLPHVVAGAAALLYEAGVADRCTVTGGNMFEPIPRGGDAYILSRVLFNWDDEHALDILRSCRRACGPDAKLLVLDVVNSNADKPEEAVFGDLNLLLLFGGHQRTEQQFRALLRAAGFAIARILPTQSHFKLIEATPEQGDNLV
jgi:SAM-dependent methyltransferase